MPRLQRWVVGLAGIAALGAVGAEIVRRGWYGLTVFIVLPVCIGGVVSWCVQPRTAARAAGAGALAAIIGSLGLLVFGVDGILCILMSWPLLVPLSAFGALLVFTLGHIRIPREGTAALALIPLAALGWDIKAPAADYRVTTAIEIGASRDRVWKHVVSFSEIPPPTEWLFHTGLAYPVRARIFGQGRGAVRYCEFSTGPFIEPIEEWREPELLSFRVTHNPAPLQEWSPYTAIEPRHLHGYMLSKHGQFRLIAMGPNRTLLEGTTWYQHGLWPAQYWRLWSDAIIHRIHLRVLNHIRALAEQDLSR